MGRKLYLLLVLFTFTVTASFAQSGEIKGKVVDKQTKEPVPFATVIVELNGVVVSGGQTDIDGKYSIKPLEPGKYTVKVTYVGYTTFEVTNIQVNVESFQIVNVEMSKGVELGEVEVVGYKNPLLDANNTTTQTTLTQQEIVDAPVRDINSLAAQSAGIYQSDVGGGLNVRGSRSDATVYYVDGIKMTGAYTPPQSGIEQITTITGGVPAQYGDANGGVISVTTRDPTERYVGSVEVESSWPFNDYNQYLVDFDVSGPIALKRDTGGRKSSLLAGFFLSGEANYNGDQNPVATTQYVVQPGVLANLEKNPLVPSASSGGFFPAVDYVTSNQLQSINVWQNDIGRSLNLSGKINFLPSKDVTITVGGAFTHYYGDQYSFLYSLFNYFNNSVGTSNHSQVYARLTQKFGNDKDDTKSASVVKNAYYTIQVDYTDDNGLSEDANLGTNYFEYGYVGKFTTYREPQYVFTDTAHVKGNTVYTQEQTGWQDTLVTFTPSLTNPVIANITSDYYKLAPGSTSFVNGTFVDYYTSLLDIQQEGGLINGDNRLSTAGSAYDLWAAPGRTPNGYAKSDAQQYHLEAHGSADIKDHSFIIGFEYQENIVRGYNLSPSGLWTLGRQFEDFNIQQLDYAHPHPVYGPDSIFQNIINYDYLYVPNVINGKDVNGFFENVRAKLNIPNNQMVDVDNISPNLLSLQMFTPDELLNSGNAVVGYYGYDAYGNVTSGNPSLTNFLTNTGSDGNYTRNIGAFQPNYTAAYIQDKFAFNDINFDVGLRVDRYDANQPVLKDPYLLYAAHTAGEVASGGLPLKGTVPGDIPSSATVYVNDIFNPTNIVGYRSGNQFYDANGNAISNYQLLTEGVTTNGTIAPYLVNPANYQNQIITSDAFTQYTPQINAEPRISFTFPISDEALFYAHYDIKTQRPDQGYSQFSPTDYLFLTTVAANGIPNPDLKPKETTDYEFGFEQMITKSSALKISAFYKEIRDEEEAVAVNGAFPVNYFTYGNQDFGNVEGFSLAYDLRRTGNIRMSANYTLQYANGTGSNPGTQFNIISAGIPNLVITEPLDFDVRNVINANINYRYSSGSSYNGPMWFGKQFLSNTGLTLNFTAHSGTPYSAQSNYTPDIIQGVSQVAVLQGSINGSRLPWSERIDIKLDHDFTVKGPKKIEGGIRKRYAFNVYLAVTNVLNTQNVLGVYRETGNPSDNGYLASPAAQSVINSEASPSSFRTLYSLALNNPFAYSMPRIMSVGLKLNFQ